MMCSTVVKNVGVLTLFGSQLELIFPYLPLAWLLRGVDGVVL